MTDPQQQQNAANQRYGQGPPPAGGWKQYMVEDPTEYSPEFQDEYRRLWHEAAAERDRLREALTKIAGHICYSAGTGYVDLKMIAREALDG